VKENKFEESSSGVDAVVYSRSLLSSPFRDLEVLFEEDTQVPTGH
jgi:hypothetical protein